jgi:hypothetical protein
MRFREVGSFIDEACGEKVANEVVGIMGNQVEHGNLE